MKQTEPIGIDLGSRYLKLLQFQPKPDGTTAVIAEARELSIAIQEDWRGHLEQLKTVLNEMLRSGAFLGKQVVGCIPDGFLEYRNLRLTPVSEKELELAVQSYVGHQLELPANKFKTQYFDAGIIWDDDERRQEIIAMAAPIDVIEDYLSVLSDCGLSPLAIDAAPAAAARSVMGVIAEDKPFGVLDIGYRWTSLSVISQNEIRFIKRIQFGIGRIDQDIADKLHIPIAEAQLLRESIVNPIEDNAVADVASQQAIREVIEERGRQLARDISKCFQYYSVTFRTSRPQIGIVLGGGAFDNNLINVIVRATRIEFQPVDRLATVDWANSSDMASEKGAAGRWAVAVGLARYFRSYHAQEVAA